MNLYMSKAAQQEVNARTEENIKGIVRENKGSAREAALYELQIISETRPTTLYGNKGKTDFRKIKLLVFVRPLFKIGVYFCVNSSNIH